MINFITNLLNIPKNKIKTFEVISLANETQFHITLHNEECNCPFCGGSIHCNGHSKPVRINHPILTDRKAVIIYRNQRFKCNDCHKSFSAKNPFTFSTFKNTYFSMIRIMKQIGNLNYTYSMIAEDNNISATQVQRYVDSFLTIPRQPLPEWLGIDEIHSKMANRSNNSSFLCVMVDHNKRALMEILPSRSKEELRRYFERIPEYERNRVKYVTIDMWESYKSTAEKYFPNCIIAVDPFHVVTHLVDAFRRIRLNIMYQVEYDSNAYYLLKKWHNLIERNEYLDNDSVYNERFKRKLNKRQLQEMILGLNENLALGYRLKEMYLHFNKTATAEDCAEWFDMIYEAFMEADLPEYREFLNLLSNWRKEILNSFIRPYNDHKLSNALTENINGRIKSHLFLSHGISNFTRFRKRMIYALNPTVFHTITNRLRSDSVPKKTSNKK